MRVKCLVTAITVSLALSGHVSKAFSAEIEKANDPLCLIELSGEIVKGDLQRFISLADETLPGSDGETTWKNTMCLNSPGGVLSR